MAPKAVLVGLPGSGKSTIGRRLAKALGVGLLDTDVAIEQRTGRSIADIFATDGEQEFRRIEEDVVRPSRRPRRWGWLCLPRRLLSGLVWWRSSGR